MPMCLPMFDADIEPSGCTTPAKKPRLTLGSDAVVAFDSYSGGGCPTRAAAPRHLTPVLGSWDATASGITANTPVSPHSSVHGAAAPLGLESRAPASSRGHFLRAITARGRGGGSAAGAASVDACCSAVRDAAPLGMALAGLTETRVAGTITKPTSCSRHPETSADIVAVGCEGNVCHIINFSTVDKDGDCGMINMMCVSRCMS